MKKTIITNTVFNPVAKTIDFNIVDFDIRKLYAVINQTVDRIIFVTGTVGKGYSSINGDIITLDYDTTSMSSTDILQVIYEDSEDTDLLQNIAQGVDNLGFLTSVKGPAANLRVTVTDGTLAVSSGTITTVSSVSGVNNVFNTVAIGGVSATPQVPSTINIGAIQSNINNIVIN